MHTRRGVAAKEHDPMAMLEGTSSKSKRSSLLSFDLRDFIRSPKHLTEHHSLTAVHSETLSPCHVHSIESCRVCPSAPPPAESLSSPCPGPPIV